ncbi:hypothetical protein [Faecalimonas umbilicata]|jgi:hypothetical protein|nr:hypothetical protein [Faecalimonas umbilicata]
MEIYDPGLFFCVAVEKSIAWKRRSKIWDGKNGSSDVMFGGG